jgi:hypothetical protein
VCEWSKAVRASERTHHMTQRLFNQTNHRHRHRHRHAHARTHTLTHTHTHDHSATVHPRPTTSHLVAAQEHEPQRQCGPGGGHVRVDVLPLMHARAPVLCVCVCICMCVCECVCFVSANSLDREGVGFVTHVTTRARRPPPLQPPRPPQTDPSPFPNSLGAIKPMPRSILPIALVIPPSLSSPTPPTATTSAPCPPPAVVPGERGWPVRSAFASPKASCAHADAVVAVGGWVGWLVLLGGGGLGDSSVWESVSVCV